MEIGGDVAREFGESVRRARTSRFANGAREVGDPSDQRDLSRMLEPREIVAAPGALEQRAAPGFFGLAQNRCDTRMAVLDVVDRIVRRLLDRERKVEDKL